MHLRVVGPLRTQDQKPDPNAVPLYRRVIVDTLAEALGKRPLSGRVPASVAVGLSGIASWLPIRKLKGVHGTVKKWLAEDCLRYPPI